VRGFRPRLIRITAILTALIGLFIVGFLFSPQRMQARAAARPLLALASPAEIRAVDVVFRGSVQISLRRREAGWEAVAGGGTFPAAVERADALVGLLAGLQRGTLLSRGTASGAELGLGEEAAHLLLLRRAAGKPQIGLLVGARAPSGEEDYMMVKGETSAHLVRGNLSVLLSQERSYWLELHLLPEEVSGAAIRRIAVTGAVSLGAPAENLRAEYTLVRAVGDQDPAWSILGDTRPVDALVADSMADQLAQLEGDDLLEQANARSSGGEEALTVEVTTAEGKSYAFSVRSVGTGRRLSATTSWSPWTYPVNQVLLRRVIRPVSELLVRQ
jgi:hypothetical protein